MKIEHCANYLLSLFAFSFGGHHTRFTYASLLINSRDFTSLFNNACKVKEVISAAPNGIAFSVLAGRSLSKQLRLEDCLKLI